MTIREELLRASIEATIKRMHKLELVGAPEIVIESCQHQIDAMKSGEFEIGGDTDVLDEEFLSAEEKKGRGGKRYYVINGNINYFPNAKYGRYIRRA
jgi:hypothetical protein